MKNIIKYSALLFMLIIGCTADFHSKQWASQNLKGKAYMPVIKHCLELGYVENRGMVFGIMNTSSSNAIKKVLLFFRISIVVFLPILIFLQRKQSFLYLLALVLILSGACGNVIDNIKPGYVVDFIHIYCGNVLDWPFIFNIADVLLCIGMVLFLVHNFFQARKKQPVSIH